MQNPPEQTCQRGFDFTAYLDGHTRGDQKTRLEQHLCVCDDCFETLINVLNQELNQTENWTSPPAEPRD